MEPSVTFVLVALICFIVIGMILYAIAILRLLKLRKCTKVEGVIVDYVQEYTSRGFLWKAKIEYDWNGRKCFYIRKMPTLHRSSRAVNVYVSPHGNAIDIDESIKEFLLGTYMIVIAVLMLILIF